MWNNGATINNGNGALYPGNEACFQQGDMLSDCTYPAITGVPFQATAYGQCIWSDINGDNGDIGPCVNLAIAAAHAHGGGTVVLPCGNFIFRTEIIQPWSYVHMRGCGRGELRLFGGTSSSATQLDWQGAADATAMLIGGTNQSVKAGWGEQDISAWDFTVNCGGIAATCIELENVSHSLFALGANHPRKYGFKVHVSADHLLPGSQHNHFDFEFRCDYATYTPVCAYFGSEDVTGVAPFDVSVNFMDNLEGWTQDGDGVVFGFADGNQIGNVLVSIVPGDGRPVVFAGSDYTMSNGDTLVHNEARHMYINGLSTNPVIVSGFNDSATIVAGGGNTGNANPTTVSLTTSGATTPFGGRTLNFSSTTGVAPGMKTTCGTGMSSGVTNNDSVDSVTSTTITLRNEVFKSAGVAAGVSCVFSFGVTRWAAPTGGTYTITATGAGGPFNITAPAAVNGWQGTTQTGVAASGGVLAFDDVVIPWTGTAQNGDTWTLTVPIPAFDIDYQTLNAEQLIDPINMVGSVMFANVEHGPGTVFREPSDYGNWDGYRTKTCTNNRYLQFFNDTRTCSYTLWNTSAVNGATQRLTTDGLPASFFNCVNLQTGMKATSNHKLLIIDRNTNEYATWTLTGAGFRRTTNLAGTSIAATTFPTWVASSASNATAAGWNAPTIAADTSNGCLNVSWVHPATSETFWLLDEVNTVEEYH
jgi:hypothetical protein